MNMALKLFMEEKGKELVEKNLYRNFVLHCCNLFEFGVIGPVVVFNAISRLQHLIKDCGGDRQSESWKRQRQIWLQRRPASVDAKEKDAKQRKDFSGIFKHELEDKHLIGATPTAAAKTPAAVVIPLISKKDKPVLTGGIQKQHQS